MSFFEKSTVGDCKGFGASGKFGANDFKVSVPVDLVGVVVPSEQYGQTKNQDERPEDHIWAAQKAVSAKQLEATCAKWSSMLPEERRWVYARCHALAPSPKKL